MVVMGHGETDQLVHTPLVPAIKANQSYIFCMFSKIIQHSIKGDLRNGQC